MLMMNIVMVKQNVVFLEAKTPVKQKDVGMG
jgi:hypothetical protein